MSGPHTRKEWAQTVWDGMKRLLNLYPTIVDDLKSELKPDIKELGEEFGNKAIAVPTKFGLERQWIEEMIFFLELAARCKSLSGAGQAAKISAARFENRIFNAGYHWLDRFVYWLSLRPQVFRQLLAEIGHRSWPNLEVLWIKSLKVPEENETGPIIKEPELHVLTTVTLHPAVAEFLIDQFEELRLQLIEERERRQEAENRWKTWLCIMHKDLSRLTSADLEKVYDVIDSAPTKVKRRAAPDFTIEELDFSVRTYNCLKKANIRTLGELIEWSDADLYNIRNFGRKSYVEIRDKVEGFGLKLKTDRERYSSGA